MWRRRLEVYCLVPVGQTGKGARGQTSDQAYGDGDGRRGGLAGCWVPFKLAWADGESPFELLVRRFDGRRRRGHLVKSWPEKGKFGKDRQFDDLISSLSSSAQATSPIDNLVARIQA